MSNARYLHRDMEEYLRANGQSDDPVVENTLHTLLDQLGSLAKSTTKAEKEVETYKDSTMAGATSSALHESAEDLGAAVKRVTAIYGTLFKG